MIKLAPWYKIIRMYIQLMFLFWENCGFSSQTQKILVVTLSTYISCIGDTNNLPQMISIQYRTT